MIQDRFFVLTGAFGSGKSTLLEHLRWRGIRGIVEAFPIMLISHDGTAIMPVQSKVDEAGAFTLEHVAPGTFDLNLPYSPEGAYVKSVMFNDREALGQVLDCSAITRGALRIVLGTDGGKVEGVVNRDDKPAPDAKVVLAPADSNRRSPQTVRQGASDGRGHFVLNDVPPGDYLAFAWEEIEEGTWFDPEFMKASEDHSVKVQVGAKSNQQIQLKLLPAVK